MCARLAVRGQGVKRVEKKALLRKRVGGARTYPGLAGTAEISEGLQASQYELGMHTILSARFPYEPYSLGALTPPTWSTYARIPIQSREVQCILVDFNFKNSQARIIHHRTYQNAVALIPMPIPQPVSMADP